MYTASNDRYETMTYNKCGDSGLYLPAISIGLWQNFGVDDDFDTMKDIILTAFDNGITHFDLANNYGPEPGRAEINFGKIFKENLLPYRDEIIISTKAGYDMWQGPYGSGGSRKYMISSLDQSLARMGLDYVDIYYHHCMTADTPIEETALAMADIVRQGKALYVGISNYDGKRMHRMSHKMDDYNVPFVINQNRYNIIDRLVEHNGLKKEARSKGKGLIAFSPLAQGRLSDRWYNGIPKDSRLGKRDDKYRTSIGINDHQLEQIKMLCDLAKSRDESLSQMAIQWLLKNGVTSVLVGVHSKEQLLENLASLSKAPLTDVEMKQIERIMK